MEPFSAAISLADLCIKYGTKLAKACQAYQTADLDIREAILKIEAHWLKIQHQLEFLRTIWSKLDEEYQIHQNTVLHVLRSKISAATTLIDGLIGKPAESMVKGANLKSKKGETRRAKYALWTKSSLDDVLTELKDWSEVFDMSWFLITLQPDKAIDHDIPMDAKKGTPVSTLKAMREAVHSTANPLETEKKSLFLSLTSFADNPTRLEFSGAEVWHSTCGSASFIADSPNTTSTVSNVCNLAKRLKTIDPLQFGVLRCHGIVKMEKKIANGYHEQSTRFIFSIPRPLTDPYSLRELALTGSKFQPLDERFSIARQLAKAIMFVHSAGFVHKNIRPETVLVFRDGQGLHAMLIGFESFRLDEGKTLLRGDDLWEANLYRHPTRQGIQPEENYVMQHDIYSLGVCLLEIGLGESLVDYDSDKQPRPGPLLSGVLNLSIKDTRKRGFEAKRGLLRLAESSLPALMGKKYTETVLTCLKCLDKTENSFGLEDEFLDENGLLVGVRFIEKVLVTLLSITL